MYPCLYYIRHLNSAALMSTWNSRSREIDLHTVLYLKILAREFYFDANTAFPGYLNIDRKMSNIGFNI